ncbi:MAG: EamA family transporter RarD [Pseudomonadota bacterium]
MTEHSRGLLAMVGACTLWGVSGLLFAELSHVAALEVMAHRVVWSAVFFGALVLLRPGLRAGFWAVRAPGVAWRLALGSGLISINWLGYIWAVQTGHATDASLGYYIFPLLAAALGYAVYGEGLSRWQVLAIGLAAAAVLILTFGLGRVPWLALFLAGTFAIYGTIKKSLPMGPLHSVALEVAIIAPLALGYLAVVHGRGGGAFGGNWHDSGLLMATIAFTGVPLVMLTAATQRIGYATLGIVQYLNPTLQFAVAVLVLGEGFAPVQAVAFALIWAGVALYAGDLLRRSGRERV